MKRHIRRRRCMVGLFAIKKWRWCTFSHEHAEKEATFSSQIKHRHFHSFIASNLSLSLAHTKYTACLLSNQSNSPWLPLLTLFCSTPCDHCGCCCRFSFFSQRRTQLFLSAKPDPSSSTSATPTPTPADSSPASVSPSTYPMAALSSADQRVACRMDGSWSTSSVSGPQHPTARALTTLVHY